MSPYEHDGSQATKGFETEKNIESASTYTKNTDIPTKNIDISTKNMEFSTKYTDIPLNTASVDTSSCNTSIIDEYYCPNSRTTSSNNNDNGCQRVISNPMKGPSRMTTKRLAPTTSLSNHSNSIINQNNTHINYSNTVVSSDTHAPNPKRSKQSTIISNNTMNNNLSSISKTSTWK